MLDFPCLLAEVRTFFVSNPPLLASSGADVFVEVSLPTGHAVVSNS